MKKILIFLVLALLAISPLSTKHVSAEERRLVSSSTEENNTKIQAIQMQIIELLKQLLELQKAEAVNPTNTDSSENKIITTNDSTPRINYWWGKVNQHVDTKTGFWMTDPDGVSGANLDKLEYCKKWYPKTISVTPYKYETIDLWRNRGNLDQFTSKRMSDRCVQGIEITQKPEVVIPTKPATDQTTKPVIVNTTPVDKDSVEMRIMYWWGKVNQHRNLANGEWETDPDGVSGANLDKLAYCKKWYPNTVSVEPYKIETINTWYDRGNLGGYPSTRMSDRCVQG